MSSPFSSQQQDQEPIGYTGRSNPQEQQAPLTNDGPSSPPIMSSAPGLKRLSEMTENEKYGMAGLAARLNPSSPDYNPMLNGFDLSKLGINLDSSE